MEEDAEHAYHEAIHQMVMCDGLTDLFNRRHFQEEFEREFMRARRYGRPLGLILFDVDHFKKINDTLGHLGGDAVLKGLSRLSRELTRHEEIVARIGGEEFAVLSPETPLSGVRQLAEKLRGAFESELIECPGGNLSVTCSFGAADLRPWMQAPSSSSPPPTGRSIKPKPRAATASSSTVSRIHTLAQKRNPQLSGRRRRPASTRRRRR